MSALAALDQYRQFILVKREGKIPCGPGAGGVWAVGVNAHDPANWLDRATADRTAAAWGPGYGVGFVLTPNDPFVCLDIDKALLPNGQWDERVHEALRSLPNSACEVSDGGRGIHLWMRHAGLLPVDRVIKNTALGMELYDRERFILLGRPGATGSIGDCPQVVNYAARYFPPKPKALPGAGANDGPREGWHGPTDDDELIARGRRLKADIGHALGGKAHFSDLWDGNVDVLARCYPATGGGASPYDGSSVDFAMVNALAYLTGCDGPRMERLLRRWVLWRDKLEREDYLQMTFEGACPPGRPILQDKPTLAEVKAQEVPPPPGAAAAGPRSLDGVSPFCEPAQQAELFKGCVYVLSRHQILTPTGQLLDERRFNALHGQHVFKMDAANGKTTRKAWEAFVNSNLWDWPRVDDVYFDPSKPTGHVAVIDGERKANAYRAPRVVMVPGDIGPFMAHLELMLPDARDRESLLSWMKAQVQYPGVKFMWAPLIQGVEGNGKSLLLRIMEYAVGPRVTARPKPTELSKNFNLWIETNRFYAVDDLPAPKVDVDLLDIIKPMVTEARQAVEPKGQDTRFADTFGNFMLTTNHKSAIRKTRNDRRIAPYFCAQQDVEDLERDGMVGDYFPRLTGWLKREGYAALAFWLATDPINPEFDPAKNCTLAPATTATQAAIEAGRDAVEELVREAIDEALPGFRGAFVSSAHLADLLERRRLAHRCPPLKRGDLMKRLGYMPHQALPDGGRASRNVVGPGGFSCRPRVYVRAFSEEAGIQLPQNVMEAYDRAQAE